MTILAFALAAFVVGALLGFCVRVFILIYVPAVSLAAVVGIGFRYECSFGFVLFVLFVGMIALQMGYLSGSLAGIYFAANAQKRCAGIVAPARRLFRPPQT